MTRRSTTVPTLPRFQAWLKAQGTSQAKRARAIGVSARCVEYWHEGKRWPTAEALRTRPDGLRALADDLEALNGHR
jgi:DNA-binding transcriptional regulator YiaG